ncbi:MAG: glutathione peroxidase [Vicinamibacterales bacterium]
MSSLYDIGVTRIDGTTDVMGAYRAQTLLVVNVASECGYTPQYAGLEALYREFKDRGFAVLGFPCDDFGSQEPGDNSQINDFCSATFDVTFPMFAKIAIKGAHGHPLFKWLASEQRGILGTEAVKWNFTKFLVNDKGQAVKRYGSIDTPAKIRKDILQLLPDKAHD